MNWVHKIRLRVLAVLVAGIVTAIGLASMLPVWPVVGVTVAAVALMVHRVASRLDSPVCLACGSDLRSQAHGAHGIVCPRCGCITEVLAAREGPGAPEDSGRKGLRRGSTSAG